MEKFQNKYRIETTRLKNWDYGSNAMYFITICTKNRAHYFGDIAIVETRNVVETDNHPSLRNTTNGTVETQYFASLSQNRPSLQATEIGNIAYQYWTNIPKHFPFVELDEFIIMPNHIHGILFINKAQAQDFASPRQPNKFGPQSKNLGSIIRGYKAGVKTFATTNKIEFEWQPRYYDHIIKSENDLITIRKYIQNNPMNWEKDKNNHESLTI
jgi:putative transposase